MRTKERPILNTDGQIAHLQSKGVKFEKISTEEAKQYLSLNNNYFKLRAYRKNFPTHPAGIHVGKYINLDFAMLKDLAIIDMRLRYVLMHMALDIEHFAKVKLLRAVVNSGNDGYQIVRAYQDYLNDQKKDGKSKLDEELRRNNENPYCGGIIENYNGRYPVWAFVEIIPFGSFISFYKFCAEQFNNNDMKDDYYLLLSVKYIRNAAAHNNCILNDLREKDCEHKANYRVMRALGGISKTTRNKKMKNIRIQQIVTLLYTHSILVTSDGVREFEKQELKELCERMYRHIDYYADNDIIRSTFGFLKKTVDILYA